MAEMEFSAREYNFGKDEDKRRQLEKDKREASHILPWAKHCIYLRLYVRLYEFQHHEWPMENRMDEQQLFKM